VIVVITTSGESVSNELFITWYLQVTPAFSPELCLLLVVKTKLETIYIIKNQIVTLWILLSSISCCYNHFSRFLFSKPFCDTIDQKVHSSRAHSPLNFAGTLQLFFILKCWLLPSRDYLACQLCILKTKSFCYSAKSLIRCSVGSILQLVSSVTPRKI
jgi:hypothetical protein